MSKVRAFLREYSAVLVVSVTYLWSLIAIVSYRAEQAPAGTKITLRIGHWQLEAGVRDGLNELAAEYQKLHPEVHIVQDAIPEGTYGQWLTTQVMGGTASDIVEVGMLPTPLLLSFHSRYFVPLNQYVNRPNPYNRGTSLEGVPWRKTFKDGMRTGYVEELQSYMMTPLAQFAYRIIYNRDLLRKLTGRADAPQTYREFQTICETIQSKRDELGRPYVPIVMSGYHISMWDGQLCMPLTFGAIRRADFNRDGWVGSDEMFTAIKTGRLGLDFPPFTARFQMLRELTRYAPSGFAGLGRDEGVFLFAQQRAVFISSGTWDALSLAEQARGAFASGVMRFPAPAPDDPEFGKILEGPIYESSFTGFMFAINRTCRHPEVALDFLQFLSSRQGNEKLNQIIGWIPTVRDAHVGRKIAAFEPRLEGVYGAMPVEMGGDTIVKWQQLYALFLVNQISYAELVAQFTAYYLDHAPKEFEEQQRNRERTLFRDEQLLAGQRAFAMLETGPTTDSLWIRYRQLTADRLMFRDLSRALLLKLLQDGVATTNTVGSYEFSPAALANARARLREETR